ncbi:hypothetical protein PtrM4_049750 [Pyrenophora tritici-repentis]|uniref:Uncharacterized protein n=1 Tax=Pyrenophora tritici-repentis TaxID=45151 RepID=A0A834RK24_9PLEO|nr:hypothetical protein A1F99_102620 [Pyrenophora tritici-repentis]KAF7565541.1 hypothetical protein PtrM4_049750 [Pyrenophora tritici-repentis]
MRFESSILIASLAASVLAAPAPYPQLTLNKRWVDTSGNPLPEHFVNTVRKLSSEKLKAKRQLDQLLGGLTGAAGGAGGAAGANPLAGALGAAGGAGGAAGGAGGWQRQGQG